MSDEPTFYVSFKTFLTEILPIEDRIKTLEAGTHELERQINNLTMRVEQLLATVYHPLSPLAHLHESEEFVETSTPARKRHRPRHN